MPTTTRRFVAVAVLLGLLAPQASWAAPAAPSLLQRIRALIGLSKIPVAAGGSRGGSAMAVYLSAPRANIVAQGRAVAVTPLPQPTILAADPLNEVRILRGQQVVWQQRASSTTPIEGPISWPIAPIQPGEELTLQLRPRSGIGGDFAVVTLRGAAATEQQAAVALVQRLGTNSGAWLQAVEKALDQEQVPLAWALLFAPQDPSSAQLDGLRQEVFRRGCER